MCSRPFLCKPYEASTLGYLLCILDTPTAPSHAAMVGIMISGSAGRLADAKVELVITEPEPFTGGALHRVRDPAGNVVELLQFPG